MTIQAGQSTAPVGARSGRLRGRMASLVVAAAMVVHAGLAWAGRPTGIRTGQDDAEYVILGRSLRAGGYHELHRVDRPVHAQYPPGYPALIAAWGGLTRERFDALVLLNVVVSAAMLGVLYAALRRRGFGAVEAAGSASVLAINPALVSAAGSVASEPPYTLLTMVCLLLLAGESPRARQLVGAGAAAIAAALTRTIGVTLIAAVAIHWVLERRWKRLALFGAAAALTVGTWLLWTALAPEQRIGSSYIADLRAGTRAAEWVAGPVQRTFENVVWYARTGIPWTLAVPTVRGTVLDNAAALVLLALLGTFGVWTFARRWRVAALYLAAYGGLLAVWTWHIERFVIPVLPLIVAALIVGASRLAALLRSRRPWLAAVVVALVLVAGGAARTVEAVAQAARCDRSAELPDARCLTADQASFFDAVRWARASAPGDAAFLLSKPAPFWLYTGHRSVSYAAARSARLAALLPYLRDQDVDYILLAALEQGELRRIAPRLLRACDELALEASFPPNAYLFRILPDGVRAADGRACAAVTAYLEANRGRLY